MSRVKIVSDNVVFRVDDVAVASPRSFSFTTIDKFIPDIRLYCAFVLG